MAQSPTMPRTVSRGSLLVPGSLLGLAALGWWWSARMAHEMGPGVGMGSSMGPLSFSLAVFVVAWVAMMGAMMFPAILPVISIYRRLPG